MKLTAVILLVYIQDEIFYWNKQCKRKTPSETSLQGDREEYITQENDGKKVYIYIYI